MKIERSAVRVSVNVDKYKLDGKLDDVIRYLQGVASSVPIEYRHTTEMDVSAEDEYGSPVLLFDVVYTRPETDAELEARRARYASEHQRRLDAERATYEALKAKFGE